MGSLAGTSAGPPCSALVCKLAWERDFEAGQCPVPRVHIRPCAPVFGALPCITSLLQHLVADRGADLLDRLLDLAFQRSLRQPLGARDVKLQRELKVAHWSECLAEGSSVLSSHLVGTPAILWNDETCREDVFIHPEMRRRIVDTVQPRRVGSCIGDDIEPELVVKVAGLLPLAR
jgi:hypothetical protein